MKITRSVEFDWRSAIDRAVEQLSEPPQRRFIERPRLLSHIAAQFALPLELLEPQNRSRHAPHWTFARRRKATMGLMLEQYLAQHRTRPDEPLPGRPQVIAVRFSSVAPDACADGFKMAIDRLCPECYRKKRDPRSEHSVPTLVPALGLIRDDGPEHADVKQWWEPAPRGQGFGFLQVRTA